MGINDIIVSSNATDERLKFSGFMYLNGVRSSLRRALFVYNILLGPQGILLIVKEAIFRYNVTSIYDKIRADERAACSLKTVL